MNITVSNLSFSYGKRPVLHNISFEAKSGEFVSILGANAVGKSSLFKCMLGIQRSWSGEITIDGRSTREMSIRELSKCIAYIPQSTVPSFNFSVRDIVLMGTTAGSGAFRTPQKSDYENADAALERVGISHLSERCFHHLSGGERQLVVTARALAQNAGILLLDEPTSALDYGNQTLVLRMLKSLSAEGYTVIQTTHNPEHSYMYSDRIVALKGGAVLAEGAPKDVLTAETVGALYGIGVEIASLRDDSVRVCLPRD